MAQRNEYILYPTLCYWLAPICLTSGASVRLYVYIAIEVGIYAVNHAF